jgi:hypothetical protein
MFLLDPFSTTFRQLPEVDDITEAQQLIERQTAIQNCLLGREQADVVLDLLELQGIDPIAYIEAVESNVNFVIANDIIFDDAESLLIL